MEDEDEEAPIDKQTMSRIGRVMKCSCGWDVNLMMDDKPINKVTEHAKTHDTVIFRDSGSFSL